MKKTKLFSLLTIYFLAMGILFLCALLGGVLVHNSNPGAFFSGNPDAFSAYCFMCGVGSVSFWGIAVYLMYSHQKWRKGESLRDTGIRKDMVVVDLEVDHGSGANSTWFGWVVCQEPGESEQPKRYKSMQMAYNACVKHCPIGSIVSVYVDSKDPENYFVDVHSARTDQEQIKEMCEGTEIEQTIEDNTVITFKNCHPEKEKPTIGWILCGISLFIFYIVIFGNGASIGSYVGFTCMGIFFLTLGGLILYGNAKYRRLSKLVGNGIKFQAALDKVERNDRKDVHDRRKVGHDLWFTAANPITGEKETFHHWTGDPRIRKERVESGVVDVYVDPAKPKDTFMHISSCVLKLKG